MSPLKPPRPWPLDKNGKPKRRVGVPGSSGIYWRSDGLFEVGYRDADGRLRWRGPFETVTAARADRGDAKARARSGERESANPRLKFGEAAERWLAEQVVELRPATRAIYRNAVCNHLAPRWGGRRMDAIDVTDAARLVRELRAQGLSEWTIGGIVKAAGRVFKFARRHLRWRGENPIELLEKGERPRVGTTRERRIFEGDELAETLAASTEPWTTLFRLAGVVGGRESELLGLWWEDLDLRDLDAATIRFAFQVDRDGERVALKTEESKARLPLPRSTALMLLEHKARTPAPTTPRSFVFATRNGGPLGQRNVLRALYRAQARARTAAGLPTFLELFEIDELGAWSSVRTASSFRARWGDAICGCRTSIRSDTVRRWTATMPRRRATYCGTGTAMSRVRSTGRTLTIAGASCSVLAWKRGWKQARAATVSDRARSLAAK
jgi:integrase